MLGTIDQHISVPHHSTAAISLARDPRLGVDAYVDEAWCIDLCITEKDNHTPLTSFEHVTTAIVLAPLHEDFERLRTDIAEIYHAKVGHRNGTGQNGRLRPDQLPTLTIQHGSLSSREPQELNAVGLRGVLNHAIVVAKDSGETNTILAVMPRMAH